MLDFDLEKYCQKYRDARDHLVSTYARLTEISKEKEMLEHTIYRTELEIREMQKVITSSIDSGIGPTEILLAQDDEDKIYRSNLWSKIAAKIDKKTVTPSPQTTLLPQDTPIYEITGPILTGQMFVFDGYSIKQI